MAIDRRQFIKLSSASLFLTSLAPKYALTSPHKFLSCRTDASGKHYFTIADSAGSLIANFPLPSRGHGIAIDPTLQRVAIFARRPGTFTWITTLSKQTITHKIEAIRGRHFYGHGVFTFDGSKLLCSENAYNTGEGVIGIYDANKDFSRVGEFSSHGTGPHEIKLLNDGKTLIVANGGIKTHPDMPRIKLNLSSMRPNLAYVDITNGRLLQKFEPKPDQHQLSIRHIDIAADNKIAIAMQYEGMPHDLPPLIAIQHDQQPMQMLTAPMYIQQRLRNYCGSVAFNTEGNMFAVTSPRGGLVTYWSAKGVYLGEHNQRDACGISNAIDDKHDFLVSDGNGSIAKIGNNSVVKYQQDFSNTHWDNHMVTLL